MKHELGEWSLPNTNIHWRGQPLTLDSDERHHYICTTFTPERCTPPTPLPRLKPQLNLKPRRSGIKCFFKKGFFHIHKSDGLSLSKLMGGRSIYCLKKTKNNPGWLYHSTRLWLECTTGERKQNVKAVHEMAHNPYLATQKWTMEILMLHTVVEYKRYIRTTIWKKQNKQKKKENKRN